MSIAERYSQPRRVSEPMLGASEPSGARDRVRHEETSSSPMLEFRGVSKMYALMARKEPLVVLDGIDLAVERNSFTSIVGPSGCGKSTLLRILAGMEIPTAGEVLVDGNPHDHSGIDLGYVSQDDTLLPWLTLLSNVSLPLRFRKVGKIERRNRAMDALKLVGLDSFAGYHPHQISGGMQKRCIIARALVYNPSIMLLDEPFGPLDALTKLELQQELLQIWESTQQTAVFVTHDIVEAVALSDRVIVMGRSPGRIRDDLEVALPRPRIISDVPGTDEFDVVRRRVWEQLAPTATAADGVDSGAGR